MSRNRPRGPPTNRDNGIAANEETDMWNKIIQEVRRAKEKNDKQKALAEQIASLNEKIGREGNSKSLRFLSLATTYIPVYWKFHF
jgi:SAGA-associated factor 29